MEEAKAIKAAKAKAYREANKERIATKKAADAKTEHGRALDKARGERYRAKHPEHVRKLQQKARDKRAHIEKANAKQKRVELMNSYVAQLLRLPTALVPPEIMEVERTRVKIKREIQELDKCRTEKKCSTCKNYKPIISFSRSRGTKDGHSYECLMCRREKKRRDSQEKGLEYKPRNFNEFGRSVRHTPEELKAAKRAYYYTNIETIRAKDRARSKQRKQNETHQ